MQIHVIRPGDTLWAISQAYNFPLSELIAANEIPNPDRLVVGQSMMIPIWGSYHWVAPGETLYAISRRYNTTVQELIRINRINDPKQIPVGLRLYIPQKRGQPLMLGHILTLKSRGRASSQVIDKVGEHLTFLTIFSYAVNRDGTLTPVNDQQIINTAYRDRVAPLMVLTNFEDGTFSQELATTILTNEALQDRVLDQAIMIMDQKGYLGLDFDFEYLGLKIEKDTIALSKRQEQG